MFKFLDHSITIDICLKFSLIENMDSIILIKSVVMMSLTVRITRSMRGTWRKLDTATEKLKVLMLKMKNISKVKFMIFV